MPKSSSNFCNIALLLTGDELMSGDTLDTNSAFIAQKLETKGLRISKKITVGDHIDLLVEELKALSLSSDIVIVNGGLGPTCDDLTAEAAAKASNFSLVENATAMRHLAARIPNKQLLTPALLKQAWLPSGVDIIPNPVGSAVGFSMKLNRCVFFFTPGVPSELARMMEESILLHIERLTSETTLKTTRKWLCFGLGESTIQTWMNQKIDPVLFRNAQLGFRAKGPYVEIKLTVDGKEPVTIFDLADQQFREICNEFLLLDHNSNLAREIITELEKKNKKMAVCESCTGGMIASRITAVPGASKVFELGLVTYSNQAKTSLVGVSTELLEQYGAVSQPVAEAMAKGLLQYNDIDYSLAVTGIAGPGGGTQDKPVGTVWIAWGDQRGVYSREILLHGNRENIQHLTAEVSLDLLRRFMRGLPINTPYYFDRHSNN